MMMKKMLLICSLSLLALWGSAENSYSTIAYEEKPAETADITLCVDLSCFQTVDAASVGGTFNSWNFGTDFLSNQGGGLYCTTLTLNTGTYEYRFFFAQGQQETLDAGDAACTTTGANGVARVINVVSGVNQTVTYGWETCESECAPPSATLTDITLCANLSCFPTVDAAAVMGSWNGYSAGTDFLTNQGNGTYCKTIGLEAGDQEFRFFFAQEQQETFGPEDASCAPNGINRIITVVEGQPATYTYGWERCDDQCTSAAPGASVEFCVDVSCLPAPSTVSIFGTFNNWDPFVNFLASEGDNIWCTTLFLPPGDIEYKYFINGNQEEVFNPGSSCTMTTGPYTNRKYTVADGMDETVYYGWQSCDANCEAVPATPGANVTLCVDVSCFSDVSTVNVFGGFNNWDPGNTFLADQGSGIWCTDIFFAPGNQEFKFLVNGAEEQFSPGDPCTVSCCGDMYTNRVINVVDGQNANYTWGFQSCDAVCQGNPGADITFCVNMGCSGIDASTVSIFGAFNNWTPGATPLTPNGDGTWCTTVFMEPGNQEYKFFANGMEEIFSVGDPCTISCCGGMYTNRLLNVVDGQNQTVMFDWEECTFTPPGVPTWSYDNVSSYTATGDAAFEPCDIGGDDVYLEYNTYNVNTPSDNHGFVHTELCGDGEISFRVANVSSFAYVGVTMRETLYAGAKQVSIFNNLSNILRWETRYNTNQPVQVNSFFKPNPIWIKLVRQGDWFFGYYSYNGYNWTIIHGVYVPMADCIETGISIFSYVPGIMATATVDNVNFSQYAQGNSVSLPELPIQQTKIDEDWNLYPNPATEELALQWANGTSPTQLSIYNQYGQMIRTLVIDADAQTRHFLINDLNPGVYWISVFEGEYMLKTLPFIKQ